MAFNPTRNPNMNPQGNYEPSSLANMSPEDYLEKTSLNANLKEAVSLLLENRPENPILFLADYFRNLMNGSGTNIMKAYKLITLNKHDAKSFEDNVFQAYTLLEKGSQSGGVRGLEFIKLAQMLCIEHPHEVYCLFLKELSLTMKILDKKEDEHIDFDEFLLGIKTILLLDSYFEEMEVIFKHLDFKKTGRITKDEFMEAIVKLNSRSHELRVPTHEEVCASLLSICLEEDGYISYDEFLTIMFRCVFSSSL